MLPNQYCCWTVFSPLVSSVTAPQINRPKQQPAPESKLQFDWCKNSWAVAGWGLIADSWGSSLQLSCHAFTCLINYQLWLMEEKLRSAPGIFEVKQGKCFELNCSCIAWGPKTRRADPEVLPWLVDQGVYKWGNALDGLTTHLPRQIEAASRVRVTASESRRTEWPSHS